MGKHEWREKFNKHCTAINGEEGAYTGCYECGYHWCCDECYCMFEDCCMDCVITIEMILQRNGYPIDYENTSDEYFDMIEDVAESLLEAEDAAKLENAKKVATLDIIKAKKVQLYMLTASLKFYNERVDPNMRLTQQEYDLLREVML